MILGSSSMWPGHAQRRSPSCKTKHCFIAVLLLSFISTALTSGQTPQNAPPAASAPLPATQIDLSALGYRTPPLIERTSDDHSTVSLHFVDAEHVLLTFDPKRMFQRLPECTSAHQDRLMHAVILELASGKIVRQADWYLHDHRPYLWPFGPAKFLLRRGNALYSLDSSLHEKLLWSSPRDLLWVSVTPAADQIIVEMPQHTGAIPQAKPAAASAPAEPTPAFAAQFLDAATLAPQRSIPLNNVVDLTGTSSGYVDLLHHGEVWLVRFGPNPKLRHNIARVKSRSIPAVFYGSSNTLQIGWCGSRDCDFSVSSFTLGGRRLWHQRWSQYRGFPSIVRTEDNNRFGVSTLQQAPHAAPPGTLANDADEALQLDPSERDVFQQDIQVFDTASGNSVFSLNVIPAIASGQNFSLSPDGRRLAVLHGDRLELFDVPPIASDEQAKYAALRTEGQDLSALASSTDGKSEDASEEASNTNADSSAENPPDSPADANSTNADRQTSRDESSATSSGAKTDQASETPAAPVLTLKVTARSVVVDVVVTDSKGHPVRGLPQQDFHVTEDGKPQTLRSFREFSNTNPSPEPPPISAPKTAPNVFTNQAQAPDPGAVTLILLDLLNTPAQDQMYARDQLIKFLESKPNNAQFALCTLSSGSSNLRLIQGFTPDEALLVSAVKSKKGRPESPRWQGSGNEAANSVNTVAGLAQGGRASGYGNLLGALQGMQDIQHVDETDSRVGITTDSLMQLARYLSAIPGRKNLVWLSEAFPVAISVINSVNNSSADNRNYIEKLRRMTNLLAESQVAVYPVDVRGLVPGGLAAASSNSMMGPPPLDPTSVGTAKVLAPTQLTPPGLGEFDQEVAERNTLTEVASATGGKVFYSSNNIRGAISTAVEEGSNYYTLSYTPTNNRYDGKFRKIKVVLAEKQKGSTLHYHQGYFAEAETSAAPDADLARSTRMMAMQHASPPSRQILFSATVVPIGNKQKMSQFQIGGIIPVSAKKPLAPANVEVQHYTVDYLLDGSAVRFVPQQNGAYRSVLTLMAASFDSAGAMSTGVSHIAASNIQPSAYKSAVGGKLVLHEEVYVPVQAVWLRLGIQDQMSGHIGTIELPLPVAAPPNSQRRTRRKLPEIEKD
ncbi:MAG TPA: VWA domain-containing protein [Candidatus Sulfotelmatobacter sp.]|nr:VWA domain-containing protein [Candidatus Sulfotelmatobacter sp.]